MKQARHFEGLDQTALSSSVSKIAVLLNTWMTVLSPD